MGCGGGTYRTGAASAPRALQHLKAIHFDHCRRAALGSIVTWGRCQRGVGEVPGPYARVKLKLESPPAAFSSMTRDLFISLRNFGAKNWVSRRSS